MITYETTENKYIYRKDDAEALINYIISKNNYASYTVEDLNGVISLINQFLTNIESKEEIVSKTRHETEEEAREYFGEEFIEKFDNLMTKHDKEQTIIAIHGTSPMVCDAICENGLYYKSPSLDSTAVKQEMALGQHDIKYKNYEQLLNWGHKDYKGLVIIAIPYECFYKEGLWNHFQETNSSAYGGQDYKIDPDFIVGYIDVNNKKIVLNPQYNRNHNYSTYENDRENFRMQPNMDNETLIKQQIEAERKLAALNETSNTNKSQTKAEEEINVESTLYKIEDIIGLMNSILYGFPEALSQRRYSEVLSDLLNYLAEFKKIIPLLPTEEQKKAQEELYRKQFEESILSSDSSFTDDDIEWDWPTEDNVKITF